MSNATIDLLAALIDVIFTRRSERDWATWQPPRRRLRRVRRAGPRFHMDWN